MVIWNQLPKSTILQESAPKMISILSSNYPHHHFPIITHSQNLSFQQQLSRKVQKQSTNKQQQKAAILIPIVDFSFTNENNKLGPSILFTLRSRALKNHANEICFPGGHLDEHLDGNSLTRTALREAKEELTSSSGCDDYDWNKGVHILGQTASIPSAKGIPVTPFLAIICHAFPDEPTIQKYFPGNPEEVSRVFCVSIQDLLASEGSAPLKRLGTVGPTFETPHGTIWGLTAIVLRPILHNILKPVFIDGRCHHKTY